MTYFDLKSALITNPLMIESDRLLTEAIALMSQGQKSDYVLIKQQEKAIGIITHSDIIDLLIQPQSLEFLTVKDVMKSPLITIFETEIADFLHCWQILKQHQINHLPVINQEEQIIGLLTSKNLQEINYLEQQKLQQELSNLKYALDQACIVSMTDAQGIITYVNEHFCQISGYTQEQLIGKTHQLIKSDYHSPCFFQQLWQTIRSAKVWQGEICNRSKSGKLYWVETTIVPFLDHKNRPIQYLSIRFDITATKLGQKAVDQENIFRRKIMENIAEGLCVCQSITEYPYVHFTVWNQQMEKITGYTIEEINRLGWYQTLYPDAQIQAKVIARMDRMRQGDNIKNEEWEIQSKDGQKHIISISTTILAAYNERTYIMALMQDITERKQAEKALKISENWYRQMFNTSVVGMVIADFQGNMIEANDCFLKMLGYTRAELESGMIRWNEMTPPEYHTQDQAAVEHFKKYGYVNPWQKEYYRKDGSRIPILIGVALLPESDHETISVIVDLTQQKIAQQENQQLKERLEWILCTTPAVIYTCQPHSRSKITFISDNIYHITGYQSEHFLLEENFWLNHVHPEDASKILLDFTQIFEKGLFSCEYRFLCADQTYHWIRDELRLIRDDQGNPLELVGYCADISDRKEYEVKLQQTNLELQRATRLKDEFLTTMSHELRTPLNAILGLSEALGDQLFGTMNEQQLKAIKTIIESGNHLLALINDILDLAKIEADKIKLNLAPTCINNLCQSSLKFIQQQALEKRITLNKEIPENLPDLLIDERRIRQVLINLLNNAVKFAPTGGKISLKVEFSSGNNDSLIVKNSKSKRQMSFTITDNGIGISEENIAKLFQPFMQIDSSLNRQYNGTGLGLALVKKLVELHDGQVKVESQIGEGSSFTFCLPCDQLYLEKTENLKQITLKKLENNPINYQINQNPLILLAEDNEANILTVSSYLKAKGYQMILAKNGQEALDLVNSQKPDLILMDISMPKVNGFTAIQTIRQNSNPDLANIPIIALTALAMPGDRQKCLEAGANDYLAKPIKLTQLFHIIQEVLIKMS